MFSKTIKMCGTTYNSETQEICASYRNIKEVPDTVGEFRDLKYLHLKHNAITSVSPRISSLQFLSTVNLAYNSIKTFPSTSKFASLKFLNLSNNKMEKFPEVNAPNLARIDVSYNKIKELPQFLTKLKKLTHLAVSHNYIREIPFNFYRIPNLESFRIDFNDLTTLPLLLVFSKRLQHLHLGGNRIKFCPHEIIQFQEKMVVTFFNKEIVDRCMNKKIEYCFRSLADLSFSTLINEYCHNDPVNFMNNLNLYMYEKFLANMRICVTCKKYCLGGWKKKYYDKDQKKNIEKIYCSYNCCNKIKT